MMESVVTLLYGGTIALALVSTVFFLRYWRTSGDRLFAFFAAAFLVLATSWLALSLHVTEEHATYIYLLRLIGFLVLLVGIYDKSRRAS